jgi:hypothetical protein
LLYFKNLKLTKLYSPGITFLQDPHSGVYNFSPYLENIVQPDEVDMSKFPDYTPASKDAVS